MFPAEITLNPIETDEGLLVSSAIRDVTDRKRAEEATARLAAIVNSTPNAIVGVGSTERSRAGTQALSGCTVTRPSRRSASRSRSSTRRSAQTAERTSTPRSPARRSASTARTSGATAVASRRR